jgi:ferritin-like metal-binding protein YciE
VVVLGAVSGDSILKALPKMAKAASHPDLGSAFENHLRQTETHVERLDSIFAKLEESPRGKKCHGMEGIIEEGSEIIKEKPAPPVLDAALIAAAQHVEHYEMAGYGSAARWAAQLGHTDQADLLRQTLEEEKETDALLTQLAESSVNAEAEQGESAHSERAAPSRGRSQSTERRPPSPGAELR